MQTKKQSKVSKDKKSGSSRKFNLKFDDPKASSSLRKAVKISLAKKYTPICISKKADVWHISGPGITKQEEESHDYCGETVTETLKTLEAVYRSGLSAGIILGIDVNTEAIAHEIKVWKEEQRRKKTHAGK